MIVGSNSKKNPHHETIRKKTEDYNHIRFIMWTWINCIDIGRAVWKDKDSHFDNNWIYWITDNIFCWQIRK